MVCAGKVRRKTRGELFDYKSYGGEVFVYQKLCGAEGVLQTPA